MPKRNDLLNGSLKHISLFDKTVDAVDVRPKKRPVMIAAMAEVLPEITDGRDHNCGSDPQGSVVARAP